MKRYETFVKRENGKYLFLGWYNMEDESKCISTRTKTLKTKEFENGKFVDATKTYTYKTYKFDNGKIETYKYGSCA